MTIFDIEQPTRPSRWPMRLGMGGVTVLIAVIALVACGGGDESTDVSVVEGQVYRSTSADGAGSTVDIYIGDGVEGRPAVVLLHGFSGSRSTGPDVDMGPLGEEIARLGATVFNFKWDTVGYTAHSAADLSCIGPYIAARAADFGADSDTVIVVGHSMGGESGSMLALSSFDLVPSRDCTETGQPSDPVAFLGIAGSYGMLAEPLDDDLSRFRVRLWPGGSDLDKAADEEVIADLTAAQAYQLDGYSAIPPVADLEIVLLVGSRDMDRFTNADATARFAEALQAAGADAEVVIVEGANHENVVIPTTQAGQATLDVMAEILINAR
jgi:pimeloyl-ACP methyl ester carboxylesterase